MTNRDLIKTNTIVNPTGLFDAIWDEMLNNISPSVARITPTLRSDYFIENDEIILNVDVAGATFENVNVSFNKEKYLIVVKVEKQYVKKESKPTFFIRERMISDQTRTFKMPQEIDASTINAEVKNGLLTIRAKMSTFVPEHSNVTIKVNN